MSVTMNSSISGYTEVNYSPLGNGTAPSQELDKEAFLKLLVAQLSNQDPLNPMEDKEFTAQLAQFSSLEQLTAINDGIAQLNDGTDRQEMLTAVSFIGKSVRAEGSAVSKNGEEVSTLYYGFQEPVSNVYVNVFDSWGNIIRTEELGQHEAGAFEYVWDGKDYKGKEAADGVYQISVAAEGAEGDAVFVITEVAGKVVGVQSENGSHYLRLDDGRVVDFDDIYEVVEPTDTAEEGDGADDTSDTSDTTDDTDTGDGEA